MFKIETIEYALEAKSAAALIPLLLIGAVAAVIWLKTGSTHVFMSRLWRIVCGKAVCPDPSIRKILDAETAVCQYQVHTNIKARTVAHAQRIDLWSRRHDVPLQWIGAAKEYFDLDLLALNPSKRIPDQWQLNVARCFLPIALALTIGLGTVTLYDKGLFVFNGSAKWFSLDEQRAQPLFAGAGFQLSACRAEQEVSEERSGFSRVEITRLCQNLTPEKRRAIVIGAIWVQRIYFAFMFGFAAYICHDVWRFKRRSTAAIAIRDRLNCYAREQSRADIESPVARGIASEPNTAEVETEET